MLIALIIAMIIAMAIPILGSMGTDILNARLRCTSGVPGRLRVHSGSWSEFWVTFQHIYIYTYVHTHIYIYVHEYTCVRVYVCMSVSKYVCMYVSM